MARRDTFSADISRFVKNANLSVDQAVRQIEMELFEAVIYDTPVLVGRARGSWTTGIYTLPSTYNDKPDKSGRRTVDQMKKKVLSSKAGGSVFLATNLAYMPRIEYEGHSKIKAPQGMVRINVQRMKGKIDSIVDEVKK